MNAFIDALSNRAPVIVVVALLVSLVGAWTSSPGWVFNAFGVAIGSLALLLLMTRGMRAQFQSKEDLGFSRFRDLIAYEVSGKGTPHGLYPLGALSIITLLLAGPRSPYGTLAFAGLALAVTWGMANGRYPADEVSSEP